LRAPSPSSNHSSRKQALFWGRFNYSYYDGGKTEDGVRGAGSISLTGAALKTDGQRGNLTIHLIVYHEGQVIPHEPAALVCPAAISCQYPGPHGTPVAVLIPAGAVTWDVVAEARWIRHLQSKKPFVLTNVKTKTFHFDSPEAEVIEEAEENPFEAVMKRASGVGGG
jgi:hypothetical protein